MTTRWHSAAALMIAPTLVACGGGAGSTSGTVAAAPTPAPTPSPTPTPTPTPSPSASPTSTPVVAVQPYVLGTLTYTLAADTPADKVAGIRDAMDFAVAHTNTLGAFSGNVSVVYGADTPTADASYKGQIRFGRSIGRRVALHELAHWFGSGSTNEWRALVVGGRFTGARVSARIKALDGPNAVQNADLQHFWPYGLNYDSEFSDPQRNTQMLSAQIADMGLGADATAAVAGTRRFQNRSSEFLLQGSAAGSAPTETTNATAAAQQWRIAFADGIVTLVNVDSGLALASLGVKGDNAGTTMSASTGAVEQQWEMIPTGDAGWFLLRNRASDNCLDNGGDLSAGARLRLWGCGASSNQQWRFVR